MSEFFLEMRDICKYYHGVPANEHVEFFLKKGVIHGLLGENGAGKSTLMNVLFGLQRPDSGEIFLDGKKIVIHSPSDAMALGIGMVHQHFMLVPTMTVTENLMLGLRLPRFPLLNPEIVKARILELSEKFSLDVDPDAKICHLSVGQQQRVEIITALYRETNILILDEPTAVLTPGEASDLFSILRKLKAHGTSIILISHKLEEIVAIADEVSVLRNGIMVGHEQVDIKRTRKEDLCCMMVGREVCFDFSNRLEPIEEVVLEVTNLTVFGDRDNIAVDAMNLSINRGEILAVAGVDGNGQKELCEALVGLRKVKCGQALLLGNDLLRKDPAGIIRSGVGYVPEDRQRSGLIMGWDVKKNLILKTFGQEPLAGKICMRPKAIALHSEKLVHDYRIKTNGIDELVRNLSGGNQQKVILARELAQNPVLLIASHPTRGLDIGAMEYVRQQLMFLREQGVSILLISADLEEIFQLADRIMVMYSGRNMGVVSPKVGITKIGQLMAGITGEAS